MRNYLKASACNGRRPKGAGARRRHPRPRLMRSMISERDVPRVLIAPTGFGKTTLAVEYADEIFGFRSTHWIDARDTLFIRDLDAQTVLPTLLEYGEEGSLVVFDDVPYLDDVRAESFSEVVDGLIEAGWEVVVVTEPSFESVLDRHAGCVVVDSTDFLLDDGELASVAAERAVDLKPGAAGSFEPVRVCALAWGEPEDEGRFLDGLTSGLPHDIQLALFVMLVAREGSSEELFHFARALKKDTRRFIETYYPFVGIDSVNEAFCTTPLSIPQIKRIFFASLDSIVSISAFSSADSLAMKLAKLLFTKGEFSRACALVGEFATRSRRLSWLESNLEVLLHAGQPGPVLELVEGFSSTKAPLPSDVATGAMLASIMLDDSKGALRMAARIRGDAACDVWRRCLAALATMRFGSERQRMDARSFIEKHMDEHSFDLMANDEGMLSVSRAMPAVMRAASLGEDDIEGAIAQIEDCGDRICESRIGMLVLTRLVADAAAICVDDPTCVECAACADDAFERGVSALRGRRRRLAVPDSAEALLYGALAKHADMRGISFPDDDIERKGRCEIMLLSLAVQKRRLEERRAERRKHRERVLVGEVRAANAHVIERVEPLYIRLFGGMSITRGDEAIGPERFAKRKARTLLAILALNRGREVPRAKLLDALWPGCDERRALNNFYSLWSVLRRALALESGECPYVAKQHMGCMLDMRYARCDVEELDELCNVFKYEQVDLESWIGAYRRICDAYAGDIMPSETESAYISMCRERCRCRITDALATGADRLVDADEPKAALWLAQTAFDRDDRREDLHQTLMRAQIANGRFDAATETYHHLCTYLRDDMGLSPSDASRGLYQRVLVCDDDDSFPRRFPGAKA